MHTTLKRDKIILRLQWAQVKVVLFQKSRGKTVPNKAERLVKEDVMPAWSATQSALLSQSTNSCTCKNTAVVAPLFKSSPTDYGTLNTVLQLTQGISAQVVGPYRRTLITLDLDLYARAWKIHQSVGNTNWILRPGNLAPKMGLPESNCKKISDTTEC